MLMAAGLGTRLRPFTDLEPKALLPMLGIPMAQFAWDGAAQAGVTRIVANIHHHAERASVGLERLDRKGTELILSDESQELLGSAGGIKRALSSFYPREPFYLLNADVLCDVDLRGLARAHQELRRRHGVRMTLTVFPRPSLDPGETQREAYREIVSDPSQGLITRLGEKALGRPWFVGAAVIEPEALEEVPSQGPADFVATMLAPAIRDGKAGVHYADGKWFDVGSPELWLQTHLALLRALETGRLARQWRLRIEGVNKRVGPETWVSRDAPGRILRTTRWVGPAYWNRQHDSTAVPPTELGPNAVLYGSSQGVPSPLNQGIGFRGIWA